MNGCSEVIVSIKAIASLSTPGSMEWYSYIATFQAFHPTLLRMYGNGASSDVWSIAVLCCCVTVRNSS